MVRLFKSAYYYKGRRAHARNWSVKVQFAGTRKTLALRSGLKRHAAAEACGLYRTIVNHGWETLASQGSRATLLPAFEPGPSTRLDAERFEANYWKQRLIHREYGMGLTAETSPELSVRVAHGGTSHYFPLGTAEQNLASERALRIYRVVSRQGWEAANRQFCRELTIAFRWLDRPLAWTYTTIHTQTSVSPGAAGLSQPGSGACTVAIVECDSGIRQALAWCLKQMDRFSFAAAFATADELRRKLPQNPVDLVLINHNLAGQSGAACLEVLKAAAPQVAGLLYSVYEDSEELFRTTPGGAGTYLLQRTLPSHFFEPIRRVAGEGHFSHEKMVAAVWQHFRESFATPPRGGSARQLTQLTPREHEVLALLTKGHPDKDIADQLAISIHTVHEHVRNVFEKLGVHNRTEAAVKLLQK